MTSFKITPQTFYYSLVKYKRGPFKLFLLLQFATFLAGDKAVMEIGDSLLSSVVFPDEGLVSVNVDLEKEPTLLKTRLRDAKTGKERGAYHIAIKKL